MSDFDDFFEMIKTSAATMFKRNGEHRPLFYMLMNESDTIALAPAGWNDLQDKENKFLMMRAGLELGTIKCVCLVHKMWMAVDKMPADGVIDPDKIIPPSQRPDRSEILMIAGVDLEHHRIGHWPITRPPGKKKPELGPFQPPDAYHVDMLSGAFRGLFKERGTKQ